MVPRLPVTPPGVALRPNHHPYASDGSLKDGIATSGFVYNHFAAARHALARSSYSAETQATEIVAAYLLHANIDNRHTDLADGLHITLRFCTHLCAWLAGSPHRRLTVSWCPSHMDVPENDRADHLVASYQGPPCDPFVSCLHLQRRFCTTAGQHWRLAWLSQKYRGHFLTRLSLNHHDALPTLDSGRRRFVTTHLNYFHGLYALQQAICLLPNTTAVSSRPPRPTASLAQLNPL